MKRIKKGDLVQVISGSHKGKTGKVLRLIQDKDRVVIEKVNMVKRHLKAKAAGQKSEIVEKEAPMHISKVLLYSDKAGKGVRTRVKHTDKKSVRVCVKTGTTLD